MYLYNHIKHFLIFSVNFSSPSLIIRCQNIDRCDLENLTLEVSSPDLELQPDSKSGFYNIESNGKKLAFSYNLLSKSYFEVCYKICKYLSGRRVVNVISTYTRSGNIKFDSNSLTEIDLPTPWVTENFYFSFKSLNVYCFKIFPNFSTESIKISYLSADVDEALCESSFVTTLAIK